jgi:TetR/AcrR family transcriptional regulator, regulator of autoinduction and epiphytic fitness
MESIISELQRNVENTLATPIIRFDVAGRLRRIQAATVQECAEVGFEAASMTGIAGRAGVSTATLYKHYKTKTELFTVGVEIVIPAVAKSLTVADDGVDPRERVYNMLKHHQAAFNDPFMTWLYRMHVSLDSHLGSQLLIMARASRMITEQHWSKQLSRLEAEGHLEPSDHIVTTNLILGPIERRTVLARLLFGNEDTHQPSGDALVRSATDMLFKLLGKQ